MASVPYGVEILLKISVISVGCTNITVRRTDDVSASSLSQKNCWWDLCEYFTRDVCGQGRIY